MRCIRILAVSAAALLLGAGSAVAAGISSGYDYTLSVGVGSETFTLGDLDTSYAHLPGIGGTYTLNAPAVGTYGTVDSWSSHYEYDPQVSNNFTVTNTTLVAQIFSVSVTSPIAPVLPTSLMRGSIGITLTDQGPLVGDETDGSASLTSTGGQAVYRAFIDGLPVPAGVQQLFLDPYSLSCGAANCSNSQNTDFGIPVRIPGPGGSLTMGITIQFLLSPGDSASVTSTFNIIPVPEPSTALTLGLGIVALAIARRRSA